MAFLKYINSRLPLALVCCHKLSTRVYAALYTIQRFMVSNSFLELHRYGTSLHGIASLLRTNQNVLRQG